MSNQTVPAELASSTDLSADALGTFVLWATDDYFAAKENLLKPGAPEWREGEYTDKGKWMDGWESQRRRTPGHDSAIIRLGAAGVVQGFLVDTTHFRGNAPKQVSIEGLEAPDTATASELAVHPNWIPLVAPRDVEPNFPNVLTLDAPSLRVTHVRLNIFPDGGVARLRVYGTVVPEPRTFWRPGSVDLGAIENGGTVVAQSDAFFGAPANMLLPGRGVNMRDGWETKRRRTPGSDWSVVRLARPGILDRVELDTHFFKGNAPQAVLLEGLDARELEAEALATRFAAKAGWSTLVGRTSLVPHRSHQLELERPLLVTHVRVHIFPHGGVNRLRLWGVASDTPEESAVLESLNTSSDERARATLTACCGSTAWTDAMLARRPFASIRGLSTAADEAWWALSSKHHLEAFAAHPRIGASKKAAAQTAKSAAWSKHEQRGARGLATAAARRLVELNEAYFKKFGFIFIICATGKSGDELLETLETRLTRSRARELETAAAEQAKITRLRLERWLQAPRAAAGRR
jgi:allantoicase